VSRRSPAFRKPVLGVRHAASGLSCRPGGSRSGRYRRKVPSCRLIASSSPSVSSDRCSLRLRFDCFGPSWMVPSSMDWWKAFADSAVAGQLCCPVCSASCRCQRRHRQPARMPCLMPASAPSLISCSCRLLLRSSPLGAFEFRRRCPHEVGTPIPCLETSNYRGVDSSQKHMQSCCYRLKLSR